MEGYNMNRKSQKIIISVLTCLELCFTFLAYKSFCNKNNIEEIKEVSVVNRKQFAMYVENKTSGGYEELVDDIYFPSSDYILNKTKSTCEDKDGIYVDLNAIDFKDGKLKISTAKTLFCNLYFDLKGDAYALYTESDNTLTFVRSKTPYTVGDTYNDKTVTNVYTGFEESVYDSNGAPWYSDKDNITNVIFDGEIEPISTSYWFYGMTINNMEINNLKTSKVTNMTHMFSGATLSNVNLSNWDFVSTTSLASMFHTAIINSNVNVSNWNLTNINDISSMFAYAQINYELDLGSWDTSNVTIMSSLFAYATINANIGIENWNTGNVTTMAYMFDYAVNNVDINLGDWDVSSVKTYASFMRGRTGAGKFTKPSVW